MKFYKFWVRSEPHPTGQNSVPSVRCFGYSNQSPEDARRVANERARQAVAKLKANSSSEYEYASGPLREPVVELLSKDQSTIAALTRVHYGAIVLNSSNVFFADVDRPNASRFSAILSFFKSKDHGSTAVLDTVEQICRESIGLGIRVYRTAAGFRCAVTSRPIDVRDPLSRQLLERLNSDSLYIKLCQQQECFRARLTPKPWRMNLPRPPYRFPYRSPEEETRVAQWIEEYDQQARHFATCEVVGQFGSHVISPDVEPVLAVHDHFALNAGRQLA